MNRRFATRDDLTYIDPMNRPTASLHLAVFETAISDADCTGRFADWVHAVDARDWLRHEGLEHLRHAEGFLPVPTDEQYRAFLRGLEIKWAAESTGAVERNDRGPICRLDFEREHLRYKYAEKRRAADEIAIGIETDPEALIKRINDANARIDEVNARLEALNRVVSRRGVSDV